MNLRPLFIALTILVTSIAASRVKAAEEIYVAGLYGPIGAYSATGGTINANFITGPSEPRGMALSGNDLFILDDQHGKVGEYNATTGAAINASLITGLTDPGVIAVSGSTLFITTNNFNGGQAKVAEYTTSGTLVNASLISGFSDAEGLAVYGSDLYVSDENTGTIGKYTTAGATVNASLVTGLSEPFGIAATGSDLYVAVAGSVTVNHYSTSGTLINSWAVDNAPIDVAFLGSDLLVSEPSSSQVSEYTLAGQLVNDTLISDSDNPSAIVAGTPGGSPTPTPSPTPPPHGGLSATSFSVNGSDTPMNNLADTILSFAAVQKGTPGGLAVRTQYSISGGTWTDLNDGSAGHMTYDPGIGQFISATGNYPAANGVSFRAIASASGYSDSISNVVGPFALASSKPRLSPPEIAVTGNGPFADLYFRSYVATPKSGLALRVQSTTTPVSQASWSDLSDGVSGHMKQSTDPTRFYLMDNKLPAATNVYFRILGSATGYVDALSAPAGPFTLTSDTPPTVTLTAPHAISGSGTSSSPFVYNYGSLGFVAKATAGAGEKVEGVGMTADGSLFAVSLTSTLTASYTPVSVGDHIIEALALDSKGGMSRFGTSPIYIRVNPSTSTQEKAETQVGGHFNSDAATGGTVYTQVTNNGEWTDATTWKNPAGKNGVPGANDSAIIYTWVYLSQPVSVKSVTLAGSINGGGKIVGGSPNGKNVVNTLTVSGDFTCYGGSSDGTIPMSFIHMILSAGSTCNFWNESPISLPDSTIDNYGTTNIHGGQGAAGLADFHNYGATAFQTPLGLPANAGADPSLDTRVLGATSVTNSGLLSSSVVSTLIGSGGSSVISNDGGSIVAQGGGNIVAQGGGNIVAQGGGNIVAQGGGNIVAQGGGNIVAQGGGNFRQGEESQSGSDSNSDTSPAGFTQTGGETDLDGLLVTGMVTLNGGVLSGSGLIEGNVTNNSGYISPGHSPGAIGINGTFVQGAKGTLVIQDGGALPNEFDQVQVADKATLGGTLDLQLIDGYKPSTLDTFGPLGYGSLSGKFATVSSNATVKLTANGLNASVNPAVPGPSPAASRNISTRAFVQTGENVIIGGFIVSGPAGSEKKVLLRGIGPSLSKEGIQGALADPVLQLYKGPTVLETNDNWTSNEAAVKATGLAPTNPLESAIVTTLAPGAYTVVLSGKNNGTGIGLVEVYDLSTTSAALLANISTRCDVQTGDNVLIGGFILEGAEPSEILVRAIGPSLTKEGVNGALADPILDLYDANGAVISNDDWRGTQEQAIIATGVAPTNDKESAILATLPPGPYTAIVSGKNNGTGVALVEVYNIQ